MSTSLYLKPRNWPTALFLGLYRGLHVLLPYTAKLWLCQVLGRAVYRLASRRRHIIDVNLSFCFPNMSPAERAVFTRKNFEHWGVALLETAIGWWGHDDGRLDNLTVNGSEYFAKALAEERGVILLGAHFTTVDLGSTLFRKHFGFDVPVHVVYRLQKNELFNQVMINSRLRHVDSCVSKDDMRQILRLVRKKEVIWYAPDHDFGLVNSVFAPFFGNKAATLTATGKLAKFNNTPVVMMEHHRNEDGSGYTLQFFPALEGFPSGDEVKDATAVNAAIEQAILQAPTQYMWMHKRFKTQPGLPKNAVYEKKTS